MKFDVVMPTGKVLRAKGKGDHAPGLNSKLHPGRHKTMKDKTSGKIRKILKHNKGIHGDSVLQQAWELEDTPKPREKNNKVLPAEQEAMIAMKLGGASKSAVALTFDVSDSYVEQVMRKGTIDAEGGKKALENQLLHNAIATGARLSKGVEDLTPMQAAVAAGIMSSRFMEVSKFRQEHQAAPDLEQLDEIGSTLKELREVVGGSKSGLPIPAILDAEFTED